MTLKDINFNVDMYGTTAISANTYQVVYTGDESSVNVKFTVTDEPTLTGATAIAHLYFADSHHIVRDLTLNGLVFNYTLVGTENDHAGIVRTDIIITLNGSKFTRAGYKFRVDTSLEASKPLVEYVVDTLDTLVDGAEDWLLQAQSDFGTAQAQRADEWVTDNDTRDDAFDAAQSGRATTFSASEAARTSTFNTNETSRSNTFTTNENARQAAADNGETARDASYTLAEANRDSQFTATEAIRSNQEADRVVAESARVVAESARDNDFDEAETLRQAGYDEDHSRAGTDHTRADNDHTLAGQDRTKAAEDRTAAASDRTLAGNDRTRAEADHTRAEEDHVLFADMQITHDLDTGKNYKTNLEIYNGQPRLKLEEIV